MSRPRGHSLLVAAVLVTALVALGTGAVIWRLQARRVVEPGVPAEYRDLENPFASDPEARTAGMRLYFDKGCTSCHGIRADGKGPSSRGLNPPPANFASGTLLRDHSDPYLYWRITEGKHGTAMPRWDGMLDETQRWQIVSFLRSLEQK